MTPWTTVHQASLSITNSWSLLKLISIESVLPSNHLILCHPLLLLPSIFPSIRVFSNESALCIRTTRSKQTEKFFKRLEYQTTLPISCEICMQVKKKIVRTGHRTTDWFQIGKGCILSSWLYIVTLII